MVENKRTELISVIVPVYNVEQYLDRCIESIINQTYQDLEIILVDDGSTDSCPDICDKWAKKDPRIRVIHKQNGGLSDARNVGIKYASGKYISMIDSDDWIAPKMLESLLTSIKENHSDIACCCVEMIFDNPTSFKPYIKVDKLFLLNAEEAESLLIEERIIKPPVWNRLYKKDVINGIQFETGKCHEDDFWSYQVIGRAHAISVVDYIGYYYYQRDDSIMGNAYNLRRLDEIEARTRRIDYLKKYFPSLSGKGVCSLWITALYHGQQALTYLDREEKDYALQLIIESLKSNRITHKDYRDISCKLRFWVSFSRVSFTLTCKLRNIMRIGC